MCYSTDFLVCINIAPRNNSCGAREFFKLLRWIFREIWHILTNSIVKSRIFSRELGWSLTMFMICCLLSVNRVDMKTFVNLIGAQFLGPALSPGAVYVASVLESSMDILCIKGNVFQTTYVHYSNSNLRNVVIRNVNFLVLHVIFLSWRSIWIWGLRVINP